VGGWITDNYSWRWIFYINVPGRNRGIFLLGMAQAFIEDQPYIKRQGLGRVGCPGLGSLGLARKLQVVRDKGQQEDGFASRWKPPGSRRFQWSAL